jgi:glycosyltransferase involved in cell wall biosynthesis
MRLLIVTQYFWPESFRINDLTLGLQQLGHKVTVLTGKPNYPGGKFFPGYRLFGRDHEDYQGVEVRRVPLIPRGRGGGLRLAMNFFSFALFASVLGPFKCRGGYDAILVYEPSPMTVALPALVMKRFKRAPILLWVQDLWPESLSATGAVRSRLILRLVEAMVRFIYRGTDRILVQSLAFMDSVEKLGVERERIQYFPNSAEDIYRPMSRDEAVEIADLPTGFRIMFAGNIGAAQAFDTILAAAERLRGHPDIHWLILGDGRMAIWVRGEIERRGLTDCVHMLGRHPVESMPRWFAMADAMLVTLKRDPIFALTIPAKVQAYMACAKPIVAALDGEGARVIEEAGAGLTAPADDPEALARAVLDMYKMTVADRVTMGAQAQRYFETHFERRMLLDRLDQWMKELTQKKTPCAS